MKGISASFPTKILVSLAQEMEVWTLGEGVAGEPERETNVKEKVEWKRGKRGKKRRERGERKLGGKDMRK